MPQIKTRDISSLVKNSASHVGTLDAPITTAKKSIATVKKFQQRIEAYLEREVDPIDQEDAKMPQACAEYAVEIFKYLRVTEDEFQAKYGYMDV